MNLAALRLEVMNHGFDPVLFGTDRITRYLNDAQGLVCRRVNFYGEEGIYPFPTVAGTTSYAWPTDFGRERSLFNTGTNQELQSVSLREIDRSSSSSGIPRYYALDGQNVHLYPTPDGVYNLEMRYWKMPPDLVSDADVPPFPADWHRLLWYWAVKECYAAEDDSGTAQYWEQQFMNTLAEFSADARFPSTDRPTQVAGMWEQERSLDGSGWSMYLGW